MLDTTSLATAPHTDAWFDNLREQCEALRVLAAQAAPHSDAWFDNLRKQYEAFEVPETAGPVIVFRKETPNTNLSVIFDCTLSLRGRITPIPRSSLYTLDFITNDSKRFDLDTQLDIYDVGARGELERTLIHSMGAMLGCRGTPDAYFLHPDRTIQICQRSDQKLLMTVSFYFLHGKEVARIE